MPSLEKIMKKEKFLESVQMVSESEVLSFIENNNEGLDLYTYFVTSEAFATKEIDKKEIYEFVHKLYADWFYLAKNSGDLRLDAHRLLYNNKYSPSMLTDKECFDLIRSNEYRDILPIIIQSIKDENNGFYTCIRTDILFGIKEKQEMMARLYLNLPADKVLPFAKEFLDRAYMLELPMCFKFFSSDLRSDNLLIYCDYEYAGKIVDTIEEIKSDYPSMLEGVGGVSPLLGKVNDYIGFGEQPLGSTYFKSRADAFSSVINLASNEILKSTLVDKEKKIIFRTDGKNYTPTEYLMFLIEKNAINIIDNKINELENSTDKTSGVKLKKLYQLRENVSKYVDIPYETNKLKRSITRNEKYELDLNMVNRLTKDTNLRLFDADDQIKYNYVGKLYNVFCSDEDRVIGTATESDKKKVIAEKIFKTTEEFMGVNTRDYLTEYFRQELSSLLKELLDTKLNESKYEKRSSVLSNLKLKECAMLKKIIKAILNDSDEGRDLIDRCIDDYIRILSTGALENVEIFIMGKRIELTSDLGKTMLKNFPEISKKVGELSQNRVFIDTILTSHGINKENISINSVTKNLCKSRTNAPVRQHDDYHYPYFMEQRDLKY